MNSEDKIEFLQGEFLKSQGLAKLTQCLEAKNHNFQFGLIKDSPAKIGRPSIGIVVAGAGSISSGANFEFEQNDILLLEKGEYTVGSVDFTILTITGPNLFEKAGILKQADFQILPSTLGGVRKLLKADEGKFNIDVHLIWVDKKNIKIPHYHAEVFELYLVEAGFGEILLKKPESGEWQARPKLKPGRFVLVPPNTVHRAQGKDLVIQVVGIPAFVENDSVIVK